MIEEQGRVLSAEAGAVWVETVKTSACGSCQARAGCGQALLQRFGAGRQQGFIRALSDTPLQVGDQVVIGVPEDAVVKASFTVYLVPLLGLFLAALAAEALGLSEPVVAAAAATGLAIGFAGVRWYAWLQRSNPDLQARVLRVLPGHASVLATN